MKRKIIFFDIDGTLSDEKTMEVPKSTIRAMHQAHKNGHLLIINTGRGSSTIEPVIKDLPVDGFIFGCGTEIYFNHETIILHELDQVLQEKIKQLSLTCHVENILEGNQAVYFPKTIHSPFVQEVKDRYIHNHFPVKEYDETTPVYFQKMALLYNEESDIDTFKRELQDEMTFINRGENFYEIIPNTCSKATGIKELIEYLGINHQDTFAVGDSMNDYEMLKYVHTSIAMGNSTKELLPLVDFVTKDIHEDGIEYFLKHYHLI